MKGIVTCATTANNTPCTLADMIIVANKFFALLVTVVFPLILTAALFYLTYQLIMNLNNPQGLAKVKSDAKMIATGSLILVFAWSIMRIALKVMGWKGSVFDPTTSIINKSLFAFSQSIQTNFAFISDNIFNFVNSSLLYVASIFSETAYAAPFQGPADNPMALSAYESLVNIGTIFIAILLVGGLVYIGFRFIMYSDNPGELKSTKKMLLIVMSAGLIFFSVKFIINTIVGSFADLERQIDNTEQQNNNQNKPSIDKVPNQVDIKTTIGG